MDIKNIINKLKLFIPLMFVAGIFLSSCDIDESLNNSPNAINEDNIVSVEGLHGIMIGMQVGAFDWYQRDRSRVSSVWTWQLCGVPGIARGQFLAYNGYQMNRDGETDDFFLMAYRTNKLCNDLIKNVPSVTFADPNEPYQNSMIGIARTYKALIFGELAAFYGSIPININGLEPTPFVDQQTAYGEVQSQLDQAINLFANAGAIGRDLNFGGDGDKWTKVCHSLKARYYLHMKDYQNALTHANQGIDAAEGTLFAIFSDQAGEYSAWGMFKNNEGEPLRATKNYIDLIKREEGDNRLTEYFVPGELDTEGEFYGYAIHTSTTDSDLELEPDGIALRKKYATFAENFPLISHEETILIRAEAKAQTGDITGAVADLNIIRNNAGLPNFEGTDKQAVIEEILIQKHIELFLEGQTYHDIRRLGYFPVTVDVPETFTWNYPWDDSKTNLRWIYPESEINTNPANVPADSDELVKWLLAPEWGGV